VPVLVTATGTAGTGTCSVRTARWKAVLLRMRAWHWSMANPIGARSSAAYPHRGPRVWMKPRGGPSETSSIACLVA
jgi:hypothetical protein